MSRDCGRRCDRSRANRGLRSSHLRPTAPRRRSFTRIKRYDLFNFALRGQPCGLAAVDGASNHRSSRCAQMGSFSRGVIRNWLVTLSFLLVSGFLLDNQNLCVFVIFKKLFLLPLSRCRSLLKWNVGRRTHSIHRTHSHSRPSTHRRRDLLQITHLLIRHNLLRSPEWCLAVWPTNARHSRKWIPRKPGHHHLGHGGIRTLWHHLRI
mmetsp:Transcript_11432/g.24575  ORF Transcript_11432/g.24575 Transcript_11432/m.24575 type:complete len:207 (+) Transcript_11432:3609-4229(+)